MQVALKESLLIYPPTEIKSIFKIKLKSDIIDKTATFVARNGPQFEDKIKENEQHNPKFNFLNKADPYRAYYDYRIREVKEGRGEAIWNL